MLADWLKLEKQQESLTQSLKTGGVALDDYRRHVKTLERDQAALGNAIQNLAGPSGKMRDLSGAAMQASYALQDAATAGGGLGQSLASASNNIAPMLLALGGPAGLTAGVSALLTMLAVAAPQIIRYLKSIGDVDIKPVIGALEELQNRIKEFDSAEIKIQADLTSIEEAKRVVGELNTAIAEAQKERNKPKPEEVDRGAAFREGVDAAGGAARIQDIMRASMFNEMADRDPEMAKARDRTARAQRDLDQSIADNRDEDDIQAFRRKLEEAQASQAEIRANRMGGLREEAGKRSMALFGEAAQGNQDAINELQARVKQAAGIEVKVYPMSGAALTAQGAELEAQARASDPISETLGKFLTDVGSAEERWAREAHPTSETLGKFLTEQGAQNERDSDAEVKAREKADREAEQAAAQRKRAAEQADRELDRKAEDVGKLLIPAAAAEIAARDGKRLQLQSGAIGEGFSPKQAARFADQEMRGKGFASDEKMQALIAQEVMRTNPGTGPEEAGQLAQRIMSQATDEVKSQFALAEQAFASRDQAILETIARMRAKADETTKQLRGFTNFGNGGRTFPSVLGRNR